MRVVRYLADVSTTGTVAGLGLGVTREQIYQVLGGQCLADRRKKSLRLDYGLLEFNMFAGRCETIAVQTHRLVSGDNGLVPPALSARFQEIPRRISFEMLRREVEGGGAFSLEELQGQRGYRRFRVSGSHANVYVVDEPVSEGDEFAPGDIWSITVSGRD